MNTPRRVFLDTNVINFIVDYDGYIFEGEDDEIETLSKIDRADLEGLRIVFETGQRAQWELVVSNTTYAELMATVDERRRKALLGVFQEILVYWRDCFEEDGTLSDAHAYELARKFEIGKVLSVFPDSSDRELLAHAIAYECDAFCTRDRRTILRYADRAPQLPLEIISPAIWGERIEMVISSF